MKKKVLIIVGSHRQKSFNKQLGKLIENELVKYVDVAYLDYEDVPFLNLDIEYPAPQSVKRVREEVLAADGIWLVTPQHNGSYPGLVKNLLDWLSRPIDKENISLGTAIKSKKITVSGAGGRSQTKDCRDKLRELLSRLNVKQMYEPEVGIGVNADAFKTDIVVFTDDNLNAIKEQVAAFVDFLEEA